MAKAKTTKGNNGRKTMPTHATRQDGWENAATGVGGALTDKRRSTAFKASPIIGDAQLASIYESNGIGARIINLTPDEMTRNWFTISNDEDDKVTQKLETLKAQSRINEGLKWANLFGGSIVVMGINDGQELDKPVNEQAIKSVDFLTVWDRRDVVIPEDKISKEAKDPNFGEPTEYRVIPLTGGSEVRVHASRVIRFDGRIVPRRERQSYAWWNQSILQSAYEHLRQVGSVYGNAEFILEDFIQTVLKIKNLMQYISIGKEQDLKARIKLLDMSRHVANTMLMDADEEYAKHASAVGGMAELLDRFLMALSASTGIPVTLLMGRSPAGENATGESDVRFWYDHVRADQRNILRPAMEDLIRYIFKSDEFNEPESWSIKFNPLMETSKIEDATLYKTNAEADALYVQNNMAPADAIAKHRFVGQEYDASPPSISEEDLFMDDAPEAPPAVPPNGQMPPGAQPPGQMPPGATPPATVPPQVE